MIRLRSHEVSEDRSSDLWMLIVIVTGIQKTDKWTFDIFSATVVLDLSIIYLAL